MPLLLLSFIAGLLTVLAPCTLPLLPVIVGGSVSGERSMRRALTITLSLALSIFIFTLALKTSTLFITVPQSVWHYLSGVLLIAFGVVTLFPQLWERFAFANTLNRESNKTLAQGYLRQTFWGDVVVGAALGPIFSSCSPTYFIVLATVLPVDLGAGLLYLCAYCIGLAIALLVVAFLGQRLVGALGIAADSRGWFKRTIGAVFIIIGVTIFLGLDQTIETTVLSHAGPLDVTRIEQALIESRSSASTTTPDTSSIGMLTLAQKAVQYSPAPELVNPDAYLNTSGQPISLAQYKGKNVVLIDFWTYSCINCLRTIPYLNAWYQKYHDQGLVIIGVHTPEFAFEHVQQNVQDAITRLGIKYPVVLDNEYATWNAFGNQYWPREYLIDIDGFIVHDHAGEGEYDVTEQAIQAALHERAVRLGLTTPVSTSTVAIAAQNLTGIQSPETYFGSNRNEYLTKCEQGVNGEQTCSDTNSPQLNHLYLGGAWNFSPEYATANAASTTITYRYNASKVYLVASAPAGATLIIMQDGKVVSTEAGADVHSGTVNVKESRLYSLINNPGGAGVHTLQIIIQNPGLQAYTFTFG